MNTAIEVVRGTTTPIKIRVKDVVAQTDYTLQQGETLRFGIKKFSYKTKYIVLKDFGGTQNADGTYTVTLEVEDTAALCPGEYFYDVGLQSGDKYYNIIPLSSITIVPNITEYVEAEEEEELEGD